MSHTQREERQTAVARARYDRRASTYDLMESLMERKFSGWRKKLWAQVGGPRVLEVGVGTGKNLAYYPTKVNVTAVDFSAQMLQKARQRAEREAFKVDLRLMDAQNLEFADDTFDSAVATFVFCSVPDPVKGLQELGRVTRPAGTILLLEHVRPPGFMGWLADILNPLVVRMMGANINRHTVDNVIRSGLKIERVENLAGEIVKLIVARPAK
jgi:ubiquinone/menaquinone biosynthesis C-methylase UbiE